MSRVVLFLGPGAATVADSFSATATKLRMPWKAEARDTFLDPPTVGVVRVVAFGSGMMALPLRVEFGSKLETLDAVPADVPGFVDDLVARILGGGGPVPPAPPPPPPVKKPPVVVKVSRETAGRRGKGVTVVSELPLGEEALKDLATKLKTACGTGGTAKDGRIEIQGDHRDRLVVELEKLGYKAKRSGG